MNYTLIIYFGQDLNTELMKLLVVVLYIYN